MSELPDDLRYTQSHEWLRDNGDGTVTVGITDHAQEALGDLVYVELKANYAYVLWSRGHETPRLGGERIW